VITLTERRQTVSPRWLFSGIMITFRKQANTVREMMERTASSPSTSQDVGDGQTNALPARLRPRDYLEVPRNTKEITQNAHNLIANCLFIYFSKGNKPMTWSSITNKPNANRHGEFVYIALTILMAKLTQWYTYLNDGSHPLADGYHYRLWGDCSVKIYTKSRIIFAHRYFIPFKVYCCLDFLHN
jgi:hypothetical protein